MFGKKRGEGSEQNSEQRWNILTRARWSNVTSPSLSPLSKKRNYLRARETKRGKGKKRKKKRRNRTTHDAIQRALLERFDKWQRNCGGEVRTCPHLEQLGRGSTPLSRMQIVCQEDGKNPRAHRVIQGIFFGEFSHGGRSSGPNTRPFN